MSTEDGNAARRGARDAMLGRIRTGLAASPDDGVRKVEVAARLQRRRAHLVPERVAKPADGLKALLRGFLEGQSATVIEAATPCDVPSAVARYLRSANLPQRVRTGDDLFLASLDWSKEPTLERTSGRAQASDEAALSHAAAAVAETGTLVLTSGPANPVTLNFLPETHIVVLAAKDIVGPYEAAFDRVRSTFGQGAMPRTVNLVSGPSRTADVGGKLVTGAHGPRRLCVIIVDSTD
jgi:L-lactate dehydrogenase complex protein LldG